MSNMISSPRSTTQINIKPPHAQAGRFFLRLKIVHYTVSSVGRYIKKVDTFYSIGYDKWILIIHNFPDYYGNFPIKSLNQFNLSCV